MCPYSGHILIKLEFSRQIFEKSPNVRIFPANGLTWKGYY